MNEYWHRVDNAITELLCITSGKTIALWGCGKGGWFIEHILKKNNRMIEYRIDQNDCGKAMNPYYIRRLDSEATVLIVTFTPTPEDLLYAEGYGFLEGKNLVLAKKLFYGDVNHPVYLSYLHILEKYLPEIDFTKCGKEKLHEVEKLLSDGHVHAPSVDYAILDVMDHFYITEDDAVFDFGCGKGASLTMLERAGFSRIGGIEYNADMYEILVHNFSLLDIPAGGITVGDARDVTTGLDDYNYFYMYDPFEGETFYSVIRNIEDSYKRYKRKIFLIYAVPSCNELVIKDGMFHMSKSVTTDFLYDRDVKVYIIE